VYCLKAGLKDEKLIKKQTYTKTEAHKQAGCHFCDPTNGVKLSKQSPSSGCYCYYINDYFAPVLGKYKWIQRQRMQVRHTNLYAVHDGRRAICTTFLYCVLNICKNFESRLNWSGYLIQRCLLKPTSCKYHIHRVYDSLNPIINDCVINGRWSMINNHTLSFYSTGPFWS